VAKREIGVSTSDGAAMLVAVALLVSLHGASAAFLSGAGVAARRGSGPAISAQSGIAMVAKQTPHGGKLIDLFVEDKAAAKAAADMTVELNDRQSCDVELLCNGGFSPLTGFMNQEEYTSVVEDMKLPSGLIFGLPVVMDTADPKVKVGSKLLLTYKVRRPLSGTRGARALSVAQHTGVVFALCPPLRSPVLAASCLLLPRVLCSLCFRRAMHVRSVPPCRAGRCARVLCGLCLHSPMLPVVASSPCSLHTRSLNRRAPTWP
jgi:hypothetical protein